MYCIEYLRQSNFSVSLPLNHQIDFWNFTYGLPSVYGLHSISYINDVKSFELPPVSAGRYRHHKLLLNLMHGFKFFLSLSNERRSLLKTDHF